MLITLMYILIGLLGIGFAIFIHELGHFIAARFFHVDVEVLSYGFGPRLLSYHGRKTEYRISAIPFGGYCRMKGSIDLTKALRDNASSLDVAEEGSYFAVRPSRRFLIYLAGPLANFLAAALILSISSMIPVNRLSDPAYITPISLYPGLFGEAPRQPGIEYGDLLLSAGDTRFADWQDAEAYLGEHQGERIEAVVLRGGEEAMTVLEPLSINGSASFGITCLQAPVVGRSISPDFQEGDRIVEAGGQEVRSTLDVYSVTDSDFVMVIERDGETMKRIIHNGNLPFAWKSGIRVYSDSVNPLSYGIRRSAEMSVSALQALGAFVTFHLQDALAVLTGPVKAAESIGSITVLAFDDSAASGIRSLLLLFAIVSVSISVGNMLPIPTFDGGQMLISLAEMIRRRSLSPRAYVVLQLIGLAMALAIMAMMYSLDIKAYFFA